MSAMSAVRGLQARNPAGSNAAPRAAGDVLVRAGPSRFLGLDYGTSGARVTVIDEDANIVEEHKTSYDIQLGGKASPLAWQRSLETLFGAVSKLSKDNLQSIAIDGTSGTAIIVGGNGTVLTPVAKMYNEPQAAGALDAVKAIAPSEHTVLSANSTLAKAFAFLMDVGIDRQSRDDSPGSPGSTSEWNLMHQADYIGYLLHRRIGHSDWNNTLKLGFDPAAERYPPWLVAADDVYGIVPKHVHAPGSPVSVIDPAVAEAFSVNKGCVVCAGTTDSIAAFLAAGVDSPGQAVTSLGSTMAIKLVSEHEVNSSEYGVYSHRLPGTWLVGGASNTGGAVLRQLFTDDEVAELTARMDIDTPTNTDYVVLPAVGELFPVRDPSLAPRLEPRPEDDAVFLQGIFEAMSRTEATAYGLLERLGATPVREIKTAGGGARNDKWLALRRREIGLEAISAAEYGEASYGAALLGKRGVANLGA